MERWWRYRELLAAVAVLALVGSAGWFLTDGGLPIPDAVSAGSSSLLVAVSHRDCELPRLSGIAQPVNAWSALALVAVGLGGLWAIGLGRARGWRGGRGQAPLAAAVIFAGVGSFAFHRSPTDWAAWLDATGVGLIALVWLATRSAGRLGWSERATGTALAAGAATVGLALAVQPGPAADVMLLALVAGAAAAEMAALRAAPAPTPWLLGGAAGLLAAGVAVWALSARGRPWCVPESAFQGHALWHLLAAGGLAFLLAHLQRAEAA